MCIPGQHYMADMSKKPDQITEMVFNGDYLVLDLSFEGINGKTLRLGKLYTFSSKRLEKIMKL
jgi:hypothetical protein